MPSQQACFEGGDLQGYLARLILGAGLVFTALWLIGVVLGLGVVVWIAFIADPSVTSPDSLNRNSPLLEKLFFIVFQVFLVSFGIAWLCLIRFLQKRSDHTNAQQ